MPWREILIGVIPSIAVFLLFWYVMRGVIRADRNERRALEEHDRERAAAATRSQVADTDSDAGSVDEKSDS